MKAGALRSVMIDLFAFFKKIEMAQIVDGDVLIVSPERLLTWNLPAALSSWQSLVLHLFLVGAGSTPRLRPF